MIVDDDLLAAFEGLEHPYEENIVRINGKPVISTLPEVKEAFDKARAESGNSPASS